VVKSGASEESWLDLTMTELKAWYRPYDVCMLRNEANVNKCQHLLKTEDDFMCSATRKCAFQPASLHRRPADYGTHRSEDKPVLDLVRNLNVTNRRLVVVGDSISRQMLQAMTCELIREDPTATVTPPVAKVRYDTVDYTMHVPSLGIEAHILLMSVWKPFSIKRIFLPDETTLNTTVLEDITNTNTSISPTDAGDRSSGTSSSSGASKARTKSIAVKGKNFSFSWMRSRLRAVNKSGQGLVVMFNIGLHEPQEETLYGYGKSMELLLPKLNTVFRWAQSKEFLGKEFNTSSLPAGQASGRKNVFIYRETSMQHFGLSSYGQYTSDMLQKWNANFIKNAPRCDVINETAAEYADGFWRVQAEEAALTLAEKRQSGDGTVPRPHLKIHRIKFRELTRPFHDAKPSSPSSSLRAERKFFDCTHLCEPAAPLLWFPVFTQLRGILAGA